jgi:hypothetical protein
MIHSCTQFETQIEQISSRALVCFLVCFTLHFHSVPFALSTTTTTNTTMSNIHGLGAVKKEEKKADQEEFSTGGASR